MSKADTSTPAANRLAAEARAAAADEPLAATAVLDAMVALDIDATLRALAAERDLAVKQRDVARWGLDAAARQFDFYAGQHSAKVGVPGSVDKAAVNRIYAAMCRAAILGVKS